MSTPGAHGFPGPDDVDAARAAFDALDLGPGHRLALRLGLTPFHVAVHQVSRERDVALAPIGADRDIATALRRVDAHALLTDGPVAGSSVPTAMVTQRADGSGAQLAGSAERAGAPPGADPDPLRLLLHTSGTTGAPSIVALREGHLAAHAAACRERLLLDADARWLLCLPLEHMGGAAVVDRVLRGLGRIASIGRLEPAAMRDVSHVALVPAQLAELLARDAPPPAGLRCALVGGDRCPPVLVQKARTLGWPLFTSYGMTETCGQVATATPDELDVDPTTVGRPLPGIEVRVDAAAGDIGPLRIRGAPVAAAGPDGWFATTDLGRIDHGRLFIAGRVAERIVSGGETLDANEIAARLRNHPAVADAIVLGLPDARWGERVAAVLEPRAAPPDADDFAAWLREAFPSSARPRTVQWVARLPRTALGKPDLAAARALFAP